MFGLGRLALAALAIALPTALTSASGTAPGDLDVTFGDGGLVLVDVGTYGATASAIAVQADGKILLAGSSYWRSAPALARSCSGGRRPPGFRPRAAQPGRESRHDIRDRRHRPHSYRSHPRRKRLRVGDRTGPEWLDRAGRRRPGRPVDERFRLRSLHLDRSPRPHLLGRRDPNSRRRRLRHQFGRRRSTRGRENRCSRRLRARRGLHDDAPPGRWGPGQLVRFGRPRPDDGGSSRGRRRRCRSGPHAGRQDRCRGNGRPGQFRRRPLPLRRTAGSQFRRQRRRRDRSTKR